jgi:phage regulator Rha-like protein
MAIVWNPARGQSGPIAEICYLNPDAARRYAARMAVRTTLVPEERIARAIIVLRGHKVLLDAELAALYGVTTARLNQQVRRNRERFPPDFLIQLTAEEFSVLMLQNATSKRGRGGRRKLPLAFTEHGAIMAATVLNSARAVQMTVYIVRAFVKLRELVASNRDLARKLRALEKSLMALDLKTQRQFKEVYQAIRVLTREPTPKRRGIGFTADL